VNHTGPRSFYVALPADPLLLSLLMDTFSSLHPYYGLCFLPGPGWVWSWSWLLASLPLTWLPSQWPRLLMDGGGLDRGPCLRLIIHNVCHIHGMCCNASFWSHDIYSSDPPLLLSRRVLLFFPRESCICFLNSDLT